MVRGKRIRDRSGQFLQKSNEPRLVRSIRLTDPTWEAIGNAATKQNMTRADLIEQLAEEGFFRVGNSEEDSLDENKKSNPQKISRSLLEEIISEIVEDPAVTRNGKDKGAAKRALQALLNHLPH